MARDYTKYNIEGLGENLNKRKLVFTIVKDWVEKNNPSFEELQNAFPDEVQGGKEGFIRKEADVQTARYFNMREPLKIKNGAHVVICNQWGDNIPRFLELAKSLNYIINTSGSQIESVHDSNDRVVLDISMKVVSLEEYGEYYGDIFFEAEIDAKIHSEWKSKKGYKSLTSLINSIISDNTDVIMDCVKHDTNLLSEMDDPNFDWNGLSPNIRVTSIDGTDVSALYETDGNEEVVMELLGVDEDEAEDFAMQVRDDTFFALDQSQFED